MGVTAQEQTSGAGAGDSRKGPAGNHPNARMAGSVTRVRLDQAFSLCSPMLGRASGATTKDKRPGSKLGSATHNHPCKATARGTTAQDTITQKVPESSTTMRSLSLPGQ